MKKIAFISLAAIMTSLAASADTIVTSKTYVDARDDLRVPINQGVGTNNANVGKTLVVNGQGNLELGTVSGLLPSGSNNQILQHNGTTWVAETMDSTPTASSTNPVTSGGVYTAVDAKQNKLDANNATTYPNGSLVAYGTTAGTPTAKKIVTAVAQNGTDIPTDGAVYTALSGKQDTLTFDSTPTASSTNPVTSGGVKTYVDGKVSSASTVSSSSTTTAPNEKAVYDLVSPIQTAVTNLQSCTHTCASSDGTAVCDLITINCVEPASNS